jgi:hypothetical protein
MVGATEFLGTIFRNVPDDQAVLVARQCRKGFAHTTPENGRFERWLRRGSPIYFNISTVVRQEPLRRRSEDCQCVYCAVLDDVGVKVDAPAVAPSWILETSAGSFQHGFLIEPCANLERFAALMRALGAAGLTDAGALGFNRLMRLPGSVNTKDGRGRFVSRIVEWEPERIWRWTH